MPSRGIPAACGRGATLVAVISSRVSSAVEQRFCKPLVGSSILSPGTNKIKDLCGDLASSISSKGSRGKHWGNICWDRESCPGPPDKGGHQRPPRAASGLPRPRPMRVQTHRAEAVRCGARQLWAPRCRPPLALEPYSRIAPNKGNRGVCGRQDYYARGGGLIMPQVPGAPRRQPPPWPSLGEYAGA
jgi:hypothetical protein